MEILSKVRRLVGSEDGLRPPADASDGGDFFARLDAFQLHAFRGLRRRYPEPELEAFCKLAALKTANAFAADYHFRNRHAVTISRPMQLQIDPANACHLQCPSCLHTANPAWAARFDWPAATLAVADFDRFCDQFGPFATGIALFRDGEPLLHRRFPELVAIARSHLLYTLTSTSLSMPVDAEALVASRLDRLVAAIDGASAETYGRYRRGGNFGLALENLRAIVRARKARASRKPWLVWQFLAFEHNVHEIPLAGELAREIGVDQLVISKPHAVAHDDPSIRPAESAPFGETLFAEHPNWCAAKDRAAVARNTERIDRLFDRSWAARYRESGGGESGAPSAGSPCQWLYYSLTMDAARRITPCCLPPMRPPEARHLVYANFSGNNVEDVLNSPGAMLARRQSRVGRTAEAGEPYCLTCKEHPRPPLPPDWSWYLRSIDDRCAIPDGVNAVLAGSPLFRWPLRQADGGNSREFDGC